ncbi:2088_t:CDS:2 [Ambispora gerdemannii]|uniref:2088_t:CDS:1 n=1 Tax=Ambispora gerdemannii TaxID=144530 RepID=A0A9N9C0P4_9GLOM|nr:2088_t:CDS:2 [Ambispora gerdemannii]
MEEEDLTKEEQLRTLQNYDESGLRTPPPRLELLTSPMTPQIPRESTYDAEMYRILVNWLRKIHGYEITSQWHLEQVCEDGDYHHFYCDLTIKKSDDHNPLAVLELLATGSIPKLKNHFEQVFTYADQLCPQEVWVVHFSREDSVVVDPYWPSDKLQGKGLNVIHFWHDKEFKNVRMSATGKYCE